MKTKILLPLLLLVTMICSCTHTQAPWREQTFNDTRLFGDWELVEINGRPVYGNYVDYFYFDGGGRGLYYYYNYGRLYEQRITYYSIAADRPSQPDQLSVLYEGSPSRTIMDYYFDQYAVYLYLEWYDYEIRNWVTYTYRRM